MSLFVRLESIDKIPYGIEGDELAWMATASLHRYGVLVGERGVWVQHDVNAQRFPVSVKINELSFLLFGENFLSPRKMLVFVSIASLTFFYIFSRQLLSKNTSLIITFLYSLSTYKLITSRIVLPNVFSELFTYPAFILPFLISFQKTIRNYVLIFLTGIFVVLSLLTYNLSYTLPIIITFVLIFNALKKAVNKKQVVIFLIILTIPIVISSKIWLASVPGEAYSKSYALTSNVFNLQEKKVDIAKIFMNILTTKRQLFDGLQYETSDFLVSYPAPLINRVISFSFLLGLVLALFQAKRFFPLLIWFIFGSIVYHIALGLYLPRMWFLTIGLLYLFAGITIDKVLELTSKQTITRIVSLILFLILGTYIITYDVNIYNKYAINNRAFLGPTREILEILWQRKESIGRDLILIMADETTSTTDANVGHIAASFAYVSTDPNNARVLRQTKDKKKLGILTGKDFYKNPNMYLLTKKVIVVDNSILSIKNFLYTNNHCVYKIKQLNYFTEFDALKCKQN